MEPKRETRSSGSISSAPAGTPSAKGVVVGPVPAKVLWRRACAQRQWLVLSILIFSDVLLAFVVWGLASVLQSVWGSGPLLGVSVATIVASVAVWIGLRALLGLYPGYGLGQAEELRRQTYAVLATWATTSIFALTFQVGELVSRLLLGVGFLGLLLAAPLLRYFVKWGMRRAGVWGKPVVVLEGDESDASLVRTLQSEWTLGFRPVAVFGDHQAPVEETLEELPYAEMLTDAIDLAREHGVNTALVAIPHAHPAALVEFLDQLTNNFKSVIIVPNLTGVATSGVVARDLGGTLGVEIRHNLLNPWVQRLKRTLDICGAVGVGILALPLGLVLALAVWLDLRGPVFYRDTRLTRDGRTFSCIKFRTMVSGAEAALQRMLEENTGVREEYLKYQKLRQDPRITRTGRFLRRTSLDELPQLWNVLRGEMSLVGPRPYHPHVLRELDPARSEVLRVLPGITGLWQVSGRSTVSLDQRIQIDRYYVRNWSIWLDFVILARTITAVVFHRGAY